MNPLFRTTASVPTAFAIRYGICMEEHTLRTKLPYVIQPKRGRRVATSRCKSGVHRHTVEVRDRFAHGVTFSRAGLGLVLVRQALVALRVLPVKVKPEGKKK